MKGKIKYLLKYSGLFLALSAMFVFGCRNKTSSPVVDPLIGWKVDFNHQPDPMIMKDCQDYVKDLPPKGDKLTALGQFYEDGTGQHALTIEVFEHNQNASWLYILIYDKDNKRVNAIKYRHNRYQS
jgi:hypothetical protein